MFCSVLPVKYSELCLADIMPKVSTPPPPPNKSIGARPYGFKKLYPTRKTCHCDSTADKIYRFSPKLCQCLPYQYVSTKEDAAGKAKRLNCKMCHINGKADLKSVYMCKKCKVPLTLIASSCSTQRVLQSRKYFFWLQLWFQLQLLLWLQLQHLRKYFFWPYTVKKAFLF
jgi:hypothetical protein